MTNRKRLRDVWARTLASAVLGTGAVLLAMGPTPASTMAADSERPQTVSSVPADALVVVVMDPLAEPLACKCVEGYAQRKYEVLGTYLEQVLHRPVHVVWGEAIEVATESIPGRGDLIIGKHSVVLHDAQQTGRKIEPIAQLTNRDGSRHQTGLFVVRAENRAQKVTDLTGYHLLLGMADADEKSAAPLALLREHGIALPDKIERCEACSEAASQLMQRAASTDAAAVISSYAQPLLEGCGTIKKGDLRVVGETKKVPFVTAFVRSDLDAGLKASLQDALLRAADRDDVRKALETAKGFVLWREPDKRSARRSSSQGGWAQHAASEPWSAWRGPRRDAQVAWLPGELPQRPRWVWKYGLSSDGLGGIAADQNVVVIGGRDALDQGDLFVALDARTGQRRWEFAYPAAGNVDYGNSPRATPLLIGGHVLLQGTFGDLHLLNASDGNVVWAKHFVRDFQGKLPVWGYSGSPLHVRDRVIVQPGGNTASLVALDLRTGGEIWRAPGREAAYSSFVAASFGGIEQAIGYDEKSLGGWSVATGERLWELRPSLSGDFNVPTPLIVADRLIVSSENNGTRAYAFDENGKIVGKPLASHSELAPDAHTPVVVAGRVFGISNGLHCLNIANLESVWMSDDDAYSVYGAAIGSDRYVMILTQHAELLVVDGQANEYREVARLKLAEDADTQAHPAIVDHRLYVRLGKELVCADLR